MLSTWLHRIVVNAALVQLRSKRRRGEQPIERTNYAASDRVLEFPSMPKDPPERGLNPHRRDRGSDQADGRDHQPPGRTSLRLRGPDLEVHLPPLHLDCDAVPEVRATAGFFAALERLNIPRQLLISSSNSNGKSNSSSLSCFIDDYRYWEALAIQILARRLRFAPRLSESLSY